MDNGKYHVQGIVNAKNRQEQQHHLAFPHLCKKIYFRKEKKKKKKARKFEKKKRAGGGPSAVNPGTLRIRNEYVIDPTIAKLST